MKITNKALISLAVVFCTFYIQAAPLNPLTQRVGLVTKMVDKVTGNSFTIRDYKFVQYGLQATGYAANGMLSMGTEKQKIFQKLEQQAVEHAIAWETGKQRYNPFLKIDLYNPVHIAALSLSAYASCRLLETQLVMPGYKALISRFKRP